MIGFRLFDIPVRVRGSFLAVAALLGFTGLGNMQRTAAWIAIVFFSILIHELGHAFTARSFGSEVAIELNALGGLTRWSADAEAITPGRRAAIAASGSAVGVVFGGLVWIVAEQLAPFPAFTAFVLESLIYVNVFWGLLNWLPIRPLDGGHLVESFLQKVAPGRGERIAKVIFTVTAGVALAVAIRFELTFITILAAWLLLSELVPSRPQAEPRGLPSLDYDSPGDPVPIRDDDHGPAGESHSSAEHEDPVN